MARLYISLPDIRALASPLGSAQYSNIPTANDGIAYMPQSILSGFFYFTMHLETPCIFAAAYVLTVKYLNACNRKRNHKPWKLTESVLWKPFVLLHNSGLAIFSLATLVGVYKAVSSTSFGQNSPPDLAAVAKSLCELHGQPLTDFEGNAFGRLSNDDVEFWAWLFYLSKFYEVLDTLIILAKGKKSSSLQTYHHAGVILCLWCGIRYMSPPMWIAIMLNSFIHTLMVKSHLFFPYRINADIYFRIQYTYFALASIHVNIPGYLKRTLTTMQIVQFYTGAILTALYLFVQYDIPTVSLQRMTSLNAGHTNDSMTSWAPVANVRLEVRTHPHTLTPSRIIDQV
jgi:hypothetical protein